MHSRCCSTVISKNDRGSDAFMKGPSAQLANCMKTAHKHPKVTRKVFRLRIHEERNAHRVCTACVKRASE